MEATVKKDHLADATHKWTAMRLASFPLWEFDDIWDEAYLQATHILHLWDSGRGSLYRFLKLRLYERVRPQYLKDLGRVPTRKRANGRKGKYETRTSYQLAQPLHDNMEIPYVNKEPFEMPKGMKPEEQRTLDHMMRGLTQQQVAYAEGVSESAISQRLKRMRSRLYD